MKTQTNETSQTNHSKLIGTFASWIEPSSSITDIQQRHQARLLATLLLILMPLGTLSAFAQLLFVPGFLPTFLAILAGISLLFVAYLLCRTRYFIYAAVITTIIPSLVTFASLAANPADKPAFAFLTVGVLFSSILLNFSLTLGVSIFNLAGVLLLPALDSAWSFSEISGYLGPNLIIPALILIAMWQRDVIEKDRSGELTRSEERFRTAFEFSGSGMCLTSVDGKFQRVNQTICSMLGYTREELEGKHFNDITHPDDIEIGREVVRRTLTGEMPSVAFEKRYLRKTGETIWAHINSALLRDALGQPLHFITQIEDITAHKQAEKERENFIKELEAKNAELDGFAYTVSHDLKSPLVTINGFLGYLKGDTASGNSERVAIDIQRIQDAVDKMHVLLRDLLELSRVGRVMNAPETIQFDELAREALEIVHGQLQAHGVTVQTQPNLPAIHGDRQRLIEALQNLIDNAAKYMGAQASPHIEIGQHGEDAEQGKFIFYVKDNGMGIPPEHHERIFGLFDKLDAKSEGTGVGLALVKRIIEVHGGRIWVESEAGKGSTFYFTFPKAAPVV